MELDLVILTSPDPAALATFYAAVGIPMAEERHGSGPKHFSGRLGRGVMEIYPGHASGGSGFGFSLTDLEPFRRRWRQAGGTCGRSDRLLIDPQGNRVFISRPAAPSP